MDGAKKPYQSKTIISAIVGTLMLLVYIFRLDVPEIEIRQFVELAVALFSLGMTIYGRITAQKRIKF